MSYTTTIGLEVHAELNTKSKMFCGCKNEPHNNEPNANICPVCMAHPGTLPVPNEQAIEMVLLFGRAVNAESATYSEFDRKIISIPIYQKGIKLLRIKNHMYWWKYTHSTLLRPKVSRAQQDSYGRRRRQINTCRRWKTNLQN